MDPNSSYDTTNVNIFNNSENCDTSYQSYVNKRNNVDISSFENINNGLINSLYQHIDKNCDNSFKFKIGEQYYRLVSSDGTQLNFLYSLNNKLKSNKYNTYTYANLNCLYDSYLKIPINYQMGNDDERSLLIKQLNNLNKNDILIADRGYYSKNLIDKLNEHIVNYVLRISKHNKYYIDNTKLINASNDGYVDIENLRLYWYKTRTDVDKDINKLIMTIENKIKRK